MFSSMKEDVTELTFKNGRFDGSGSALILGNLGIEFEFVADYSGRALITSHYWDDSHTMNEAIEGLYLRIIEELISNDL